MKTDLSILMFLFAVTTCGHADVHVKLESHTDSYYYGGITYPEENEVWEAWVGDNKSAYISERRSVIVDLNTNMLSFINHLDSTYAEAALPFQWPNLVSEEMAGRLEMYRTTGTVTESREIKTIGKWACQRYDVNSWIPYAGGRYDEREIVLWITPDVPIDINVYKQIRTVLRQLRNYDEVLVSELGKIEGYQIASETTTYVKGFGYQSTEWVTDMSERQPPADVYSVPEGYTKKEALTWEDLE
ncbi:MAG: hypothetical protein JSV84_07130 [Gemmatimonadota bacterium]|nr:MAG: hypothetical protein JSV84_07130 [Gemmatimonadota bacterium]